MVFETLNQISLWNIPELHSSIIGTAAYNPSVWGELARPDPISMGIDCEVEFSINSSEDFEGLVIGTWQDKASVTG